MTLDEYQENIMEKELPAKDKKQLGAVLDLAWGTAKLTRKYHKLMEGGAVSHIPLLLEIGYVLRCVAKCANAFGYTMEQVAREEMNLKDFTKEK